MPTQREKILIALAALMAVPGVDADSITRERATAVDEKECPAIDIAPDSEPAPLALGRNVDQHDLTVEIKIYTAGNGAYSLADPHVSALHSAIFADPTLGGIATTITPGATDFARDNAGQTLGRTTVRYRIIYTTRRGDLTRSA